MFLWYVRFLATISIILDAIFLDLLHILLILFLVAKIVAIFPVDASPIEQAIHIVGTGLAFNQLTYILFFLLLLLAVLAILLGALACVDHLLSRFLVCLWLHLLGTGLQSHLNLNVSFDIAVCIVGPKVVVVF